MKIYAIIPLIALVLIGAPAIVSAETVVRTGDEVTIAKDQKIEEDFYAMSGTVSMSGEVAGDMYALGGTVTTNGAVGEDLVIVAGTAQVHATVTDDVRSFSGETVIAEHVGGDVFVIGGSLKILSTATIDGNIYFHGGELTVEGEVAGSIMGAVGSARIDAAVGGNVDLTLGRVLEVGDRASIEGDVIYTGGSFSRGQNAVVVGNVVENTVQSTEVPQDNHTDWIPFIITLFSTLCVYLLFKKELVRIVETVRTAPVASTLSGLAGILFVPVLVLFLLVTVLGALLGLAGFLLSALLFVFSFVIMPVTLGAIVATLFKSGDPVSLIWIIVGAFTLKVLSFMPVLGAFVYFVVFVISLGAVLYTLYRHFRAG